MSANPPKRDAWPPWRDTRFVLVRSPGKLRPRRGLVLDWRSDRGRWSALVTYYDDTGPSPVVKTEWLNVQQLVPVPVDPNWQG